MKQICTKYLAVSLDKELSIYDIVTGQHLRSIATGQPFQYLIRVNPRGMKFEFDIVAEACIGYSYKNFFECGITVEKGPLLQDF